MTLGQRKKPARERQKRWRERQKAQGKRGTLIVLSQEARAIIDKEQARTGETKSAIADRAIINLYKPLPEYGIYKAIDEIRKNLGNESGLIEITGDLKEIIEEIKEGKSALAEGIKAIRHGNSLSVSRHNGDQEHRLEKVAKQTQIEEKWLLFMEASTEAFSLLDSDLNLIEMNDAALRLFPAGTRKEGLIGKNLVEFAPGAKERGDVDNFLKVLETGEPFSMDEVVPPPKFGDRILNYRAFKVGENLGLIIWDITEVKRREDELKQRERELEETNTALKVLLKRREEDKTELEENMLFNIKELVAPYIENLKRSKLDSSQRAYINIIQSNLNDIVSPLVRTLSTQLLRLTQMETQIANLIKQGKTTKEIAELFHLSPRTIESYRDSIRKKLGIKNKNINLRTYLLSFK